MVQVGVTMNESQKKEASALAHASFFDDAQRF